MATHSSILAWEIPWIEEPGRLQSLGGSKRIRHDLVTKQKQQYIEIFDFSVLNLHPTTLLSPLISCNNFFVDYIGFFYIGIISSMNEDNEISF